MGDFGFGRREGVYASNGGFVECDGEALFSVAFPKKSLRTYSAPSQLVRNRTLGRDNCQKKTHVIIIDYNQREPEIPARVFDYNRL